MKFNFGNVLIWSSVFVTVLLFLLAKNASNGFWGNNWVTFSQILSLTGTVLLSITFVLSGRFMVVENWFKGLDKVYKTHHLLGAVSFVMLIHHPLFLAVNALPNYSASFMYFWPANNFAYNAGIFGLYSMILMLILTLLVNLPYSLWKKTHEFMGVGLFFSTIHILNISSDVSRYFPLRLWILFMLFVAICSVIYRRIIYKYFGPKYSYVIEKIDNHGDVYDIQLTPKDKKMLFRPGQFAFFVFKDIGGESHPFSIANTGSEGKIRVAIKKMGDFTNKIANLRQGGQAYIWGPYGKLWESSLTKNDLVWVAGGIGVTPFLSLLEDEINSGKNRQVNLFYCASTKSEAVFDSEISLKIQGLPNIKYWQTCSSVEGRISGEMIKSCIKDLSNKKFVLCGPVAMMEALTTQLKSLGVKNSNIVYEDFYFK